MKTQILKVLSIASFIVVLTVASASANISEPLKVNIPFAFTVGNQTLPAGAYKVNTVAGKTLQIRSMDNKQVATIHTNNLRAEQTPGHAKLSFRRYGDRYFLIQVWAPWEGYEMPRSRAELEFVKDSAKHPAQKAAKLELIFINAE